jgi:Regulator of Ty1 transposition protein 107 BRCT domain
LRTPKFVNALAYSPVIVNLDFVIQCLEKNELLDPSDYLLMDEATEKKIGFRLAEARNRAQVNKNKLLRGYHVCCLESIRGGFDAFKSIVETNGGECTLFRGKVSMGDPHIPADDHDSGGAEGKSNGEDLYLLSGILPDQVKLWHRFRRMATDVGKRPRIVQVNWLLDIAMSQEIRWKDEYELSEDMVGE